jgi:YwiC-like protein
MAPILVVDHASHVRPGQRARTRALVVPREHGAWGLLFVPLLTGVAVGAASAQSVLPLIWFSIAALALFWLRTPVESLLGTTPLSVQTSGERKIAVTVSVALAATAFAALAALLWNGRSAELMLFGAVAALAFMAQTLIMRLGRKRRMTALIVGAIGLTCTAPAAYYLATVSLDRRAWWLWMANWLFAVNQIHFVQLRIHAARVATFEEKCSRGWGFFLGQVLLIMTLIAATVLRFLPGLVALAFLPALARGFAWFFRGPQPLNVKSLGWSEMRQGVVFGILLATASIVS